jgi:iron complex transport system ATP-binding protein
MTISARQLTVRYPTAPQPALHDVSMELGAGELLVVAGPNGSGKSTLFRALLGMTDLLSGDVLVAGKPVNRWRRDALAQLVGALPQREEPVFPQRVLDAVMLGRWSRLGALAPITTADRHAVDAAIARTGLEGLVHRGTDTLSGGEWQRVRLARALAGEPKFLLLDEPGTALDLAHEMTLLETLRALANAGMGVLAITHHLNAATQYADRVLLLDRGTVAAVGAPAEVLTADAVSRVFGWPVSVEQLRSGALHLVPLRNPDRPHSHLDQA